MGAQGDEGRGRGTHEGHESDESNEGYEESNEGDESYESNEGYEESNEGHESYEGNEGHEEVSASFHLMDIGDLVWCKADDGSAVVSASGWIRSFEMWPS